LAAIIARHCYAAIVRDPIPERPVDTRLASEFAQRATPLDIDNVELAVRRRVRRISADLESGSITAANWSRRMKTLLRSAHVAAAALGRGMPLRSGDWRRLDAEITAADQQIENIARLARIGCYVTAASRSRRLARSVRTSYDAARRAIAAETAQ
jgi:hypothetical protein